MLRDYHARKNVMSTNRPDPFVRKNPGDVIRSGDWNELQVLARENIDKVNGELKSHNHAEGVGLKIPGEGIEEKAINESHIDPESNLVINQLNVATETQLAKAKISQHLSIATRSEKHLLNLPGDNNSLSLGDNIFINGQGSTGRISNNAFIQDGKWTISDPAARASTIELRDNGMIEMYGTATPGGTDWRKMFGFDASLNVAYFPGKMVRRMFIATGLGPNDETDNGQIKSRVLNFNKAYNDTAIRIQYCDNFRIYCNNCAARWEIRVDGKAPPGGPIYQDKYTGTAIGTITNQHEFTTILGYAQGLPAGDHQIQIWVGPAPGYGVANYYTGWNNSRWTIEAEEVWI